MNSTQKLNDFPDKYAPPPPTVYKSQWYHGTLSRNESERIIRKHAKTIHENKVSPVRE